MAHEEEDEGLRQLMGPGDMTLEELQRIEEVANLARKHRDEEHPSSKLHRNNSSPPLTPSSIFLSEPTTLYHDFPEIKQLDDEEEFAHVDIEWTEDDLNRIDLLSQPPSSKQAAGAWTYTQRGRLSPEKVPRQKQDTRRNLQSWIDTEKNVWPAASMYEIFVDDILHVSSERVLLILLRLL
jgi:hypothetical protein